MTESLLPKALLQELQAFNRLLVGFSGGLDSTVLLHALSNTPLRDKLLAVHVNHGLNPKASEWQAHCQDFCLQRGLAFHSQAVSIDKNSNVEERARQARYAVFTALLHAEDCLVLGHHQNDQAETLLLQLMRGTGVDGLAAMTAMRLHEGIPLLRPFLQYSRQQLQDYAVQHQLTWIEDDSNADCSFARNFVRQEVIPLLESRWPEAVSAMARTANHCQQAAANLESLALQDALQALNQSTLNIQPLRSLSRPALTNVLRVWLKKNKVRLPAQATFRRLMDEAILPNNPNAQPLISWGSSVVRLYQDRLYLETKTKPTSLTACDWLHFPQPLMTAAGLLTATVSQQKGIAINPGDRVQVRYRQGGETIIWHGQTKSLKKLLQTLAIPPWLRNSLPLLYVNGQLASVLGYLISDNFYQTGGYCIQIITQV